jgi:hypothetical protein
MGAAGRDFHNFNLCYRDNRAFEVVGFTATQIPNISERRYPAQLAGSLYPDGIPIYEEDRIEELIRTQKVDLVVFAYSDVSHAHVMHKASQVVAAGADFVLLGFDATSLKSKKPVVSVCAVRTGAGIKTCSLTSHSETTFEFEIAMGEPQIGDEFAIKVAFGDVRGIPVSMGNPHYVVFVSEFGMGWQAEAAEIGRHPDFNYGVNVELLLVKDKSNIEVRFFERGVGETQSSGTGSCAGRTRRSWPSRGSWHGTLQCLRPAARHPKASDRLH